METEYLDASIDWNVSICAPAVRLLIIRAWSDGGSTGYRLVPVIAIRSRVRSLYSRRRRNKNDYPSDHVTHKEMIEDGFRSNGRDVTTEPIVVGEFGDLDVPGDDCENEYSRLVACPWDAKEDEAMLKEEIDEVRQGALDKQLNADRKRNEKDSRAAAQ